MFKKVKKYLIFSLPLILALALFAGCSEEDSPLTFYVKDVDPLSTSYSGAAVPVTVDLALEYTGSNNDAAPSGATIDKLTLSARTISGTDIGTVTPITLVFTAYVATGGTSTFTADDVIWTSMKTYMDAAATPSQTVVHFVFNATDTSGNILTAEGDMTLTK